MGDNRVGLKAGMGTQTKLRYRGTITHPDMERAVQVFGQTQDEVLNCLRRHLPDAKQDAVMCVYTMVEHAQEYSWDLYLDEDGRTRVRTWIEGSEKDKKEVGQ